MAVLTTTGQKGAFALAPQVTALPPLGLFHDLRWLFVYHASDGSFAWETVALLAFRTLLLGSLIRTAWPVEHSPPDWAKVLGRALAFNLVGFLVLSPFVLLIFAASATALTWPWFAGMIPLFCLTLLMHPWVLLGAWRRLPTLRSFGWLLLTWPVLTLAAAAIELTPLWAAFLLAALLGAFNAAAWSAATRSLVLAPEPTTFRFFATVAIVLIYGGLLVGLHLVFSDGGSDPEPRTQPDPVVRSDKPILLLVQGLGSSWSGGPVPEFGEGFQGVVFSYRGLGSGGDPLPYTPQDTRQALTNGVKLLEQQIQALGLKSQRPFDIVCISEGSLITQIYLATHPHAPISTVVIASPILAPALVYFPPEGQGGWGVVTGLGLHGWLHLFELFGWQRPNRLPVLRSMLEHGPLMARIERCPMGPATETVLMPLSSSVILPLDLSTHLPTYPVGLVHGDVLRLGSGKSAARAALAGQAPAVPFWRTCVVWVGRTVGSAWRVPPLAPALPASWKYTQVQFPHLDCAATRQLARQTFQPLVEP